MTYTRSVYSPESSFLTIHHHLVSLFSLFSQSGKTKLWKMKYLAPGDRAKEWDQYHTHSDEHSGTKWLVFLIWYFKDPELILSKIQFWHAQLSAFSLRNQFFSLCCLYHLKVYRAYLRWVLNVGFIISVSQMALVSMQIFTGFIQNLHAVWHHRIFARTHAIWEKLIKPAYRTQLLTK